jgi:xanthine dehydrogenase iron-sulfur cluster and FAD-binding subunit A
VLLALDAEVELGAREGRRIARRLVPLERFFVDYRRTAARPEELILAVLVPAAALEEGWRYAYRKVGTRQAQTISKVVAAVGLRARARPRRIEAARIAYGSMAPTPVRARAAEAALAGREPGREAGVAAAAALLAHDLRPIDDLRSTAAYRSLVAGRLLESLLGALGGYTPALGA